MLTWSVLQLPILLFEEFIEARKEVHMVGAGRSH